MRWVREVPSHFEQLQQFLFVKMVPKSLDAVHEHYGDFLFETLISSTVFQDIYFTPGKFPLPLKATQLRFHLVTEAAAGLRIQDDLIFYAQS